MLYEMILGEPPFSGDTPDEIFAQVTFVFVFRFDFDFDFDSILILIRLID